MSFKNTNEDHGANRARIVTVELNGEDWTFEEGGFHAVSPEFPLLCYGIASNSAFPQPNLKYAVDQQHVLWVGADDGILYAEDDIYLLGILFEYNPVSWARACHALGDDIVQAIVDACEWNYEEA
jgi:hypothetical protein